MQAKRDPKRKAELLSKFTDYLVRTGISDLSLRPAAAALGTSARMLIYYFGSREQMLIEAMAEIRARERAQIADRIREQPFSGSVADVMRAIWQWYAGKEREPYLRLLFELYGRAFLDPQSFKGFLDTVTEDYFVMIEDGLRSLGFSRRDSRTAATLYRATFRGLLIDLLSTGDRARIDAAVKVLAEAMEADVDAVRTGRGRAAAPSFVYTATGEPGVAKTRRRASASARDRLQRRGD